MKPLVGIFGVAMETKRHTNTKCIALGLSKNMTFALGTLLLNLKSLGMTSDTDVIVFHDGISNHQQEIMSSIATCVFVPYKSPFKSLRVKLSRSVRRFTPMVFSKYEAFQLLDKYESVMWLDYDICILSSIDHLWSSPSEALTILIADNRVGDSFYGDISGYDMNRSGVATGLFIVKRGIGDFSNLYNWCITMTKKHIDDLYLPEQGIFNLLVESFRLPLKPLDIGVYAAHPSETTKKSLIIHSWGQPKFWNGHQNENWEKYYKIWKSLGGESYVPSMGNMPRHLRYTYALFDRIVK
jgi:lipopolysaccharide biosynthesis glycosyltransferase